MKYTLLLVLVFTLCSCQSMHTAQVNDGHVQATTVEQTREQQVKAATKDNIAFLKEVLAGKLAEVYDEGTLRNLIRFLEETDRMNITGRSMFISPISVGEFPFFLEDIFNHQEILNTLPRDVNNLLIVDRYGAALGVKNVFYMVPTTLIPKPLNLYDLMPIKSDWIKYIDKNANEFGDEIKEEAVFMQLLYEANVNVGNQTFAIAMAAAKDSSELVHPDKFPFKYVLIPIATIRSSAMERYIRTAQGNK